MSDRDSSPRVPLVAAAYLVLTREREGRTEVLLQHRSGTGYMDGWWGCGAAGHVEAGESALQAAVGEAREELGITVDPDDLAPLTTVQRHSVTGLPVEQRCDIFFGCTRWQGSPRIREPELTDGLDWFALDDLPDRVVPHERLVLDALPDPPAFLTRGFDQRLTLVAAMGRNRVIGADGTMPWHLPEDLEHFKRTTAGGTLLMGRTTWDSIGRPLPGRTSIVLTRDPDWRADGAIAVRSLAEAVTAAPDRELFVIGGGQIYRQTIDLADRLVLTLIDAEFQGDTTFPEFGSPWTESSREQRDGFAFVDYRRGADGRPSDGGDAEG